MTRITVPVFQAATTVINDYFSQQSVYNPKTVQKHVTIVEYFARIYFENPDRMLWFCVLVDVTHQLSADKCGSGGE